LNSRAGIRSDSHSLSEEASQISLETELISVAGAVRLASSFDHDASCVFERLEKCLVDLLNQASQTCLPGRRGVGIIVHHSSAINVDTRVVGPLQRYYIFTVAGGTSTVVDTVAVVDQAGSCSPVIDLLGPIGVCAVAGITGQASCHLEKSSVRDRVLVVPSGVERKDLPSQSTIAC
jgi:hypothetical protein